MLIIKCFFIYENEYFPDHSNINNVLDNLDHNYNSDACSTLSRITDTLHIRYINIYIYLFLHFT